MKNVRASVVQAAPVAFDREKTLEKVGDLAADAAREGAELVVFPEAFVSAYPKGLDFGARVGMRTAEGAGRLDGGGIVLRSPDGSRTLLRLEGERLTFESAPPGADSALLRTVYERRPPD